MQPSVLPAKSSRDAFAVRGLGLIPNMRWFLLVAIVMGIVFAGIHPALAQTVTRASMKPGKTVSVATTVPTTSAATTAPTSVQTLDEASVPPPSAATTALSPGGTWIAGRLLVAPNAGLSDEEFDKVLNAVGAKSRRKLGPLNVHVVELPEAAHGNERAIAARLAHNPHFKFAEVDELVTASGTTNDPILPSEWHIPKIGAQTAWDYSTGSNIVVAVIDTGVQSTHPDLAANMVPGWNVYDNNSNANDVQGHGTAVAGTIAAVGDNGIGAVGIAYRAKIMPIRATDTSANSTFSIVASALTWAADHGADVANISFSNLYKSSTVQSAAQYLRDRGGITVVSANNNAIDENSPNTSTMITVSATDENDALASFSSWGSMVDLAAPGVTIQTTLWNSGYGWGTGTSFATPNVSGAVALVMAANPALAPSQVESALFNKATDLGGGGYDTKYGWGRVNAAAAVQSVLGAPATDTTKPIVAVASPTGGTLSGLVPVSVSASDNVGVTRVELYAGSTLIGTDTTSPYTFSWDTTKFANSGYSLSTSAYDAAGNVGTSAPVAVTVSNVTAPPSPPPPTIDSAPPAIAIGNPKNGQRVKGNVTIQASASDNVGVKSVSLYVDGTLIGTGNSASLTANWNAQKALKGTHTIKAVATDAAGNAGSVTISVYNN